MSNDWEGAELVADAEKWRSIKKILKDWVGEVALQSRGTLSDGITPMCGKFETEELWRQANTLLGVFSEKGRTHKRPKGATLAFPAGFVWINQRCMVKGEDFTYYAVCLCSFPKKDSNKVRYIVEDNGRLFIQRAEQIVFLEDRPFNPEPKPKKHPPTCECGECWQIMEGSGRG